MPSKVHLRMGQDNWSILLALGFSVILGQSTSNCARKKTLFRKNLPFGQGNWSTLLVLGFCDIWESLLAIMLETDTV